MIIKKETIINDEMSIIDGNILVEGAESDIDSYGWLNIPENVIALGAGAYANSKALQGINNISDACIVCDGVFTGCKNLESVFLVPKEKDKTPLHRILGNYAFADCTSLKRLIIDDSFIALGNNAFENCVALENVVLPRKLGKIGDEAFAGCKNIQTIEIPDGVTEIGREVFKGCNALQVVIIPEHLLEECEKNGTFKNCPRLQLIVKPEKIKEEKKVKTPEKPEITIKSEKSEKRHSIEDNPKSLFAILKQRELQAKLDEENKMAKVPEKSADVEDDTPSAITVVLADDGAFQNWKSLKRLYLNENMNRIGNYAFAGCSSIETVDIPDSITEIGNGAFKDCESLKSVELPEHLVEMCEENKVFENCPNVQMVVRPKNSLYFLMKKRDENDGWNKDTDRAKEGSALFEKAKEIISNGEDNAFNNWDSVKREFVKTSNDVLGEYFFCDASLPSFYGIKVPEELIEIKRTVERYSPIEDKAKPAYHALEKRDEKVKGIKNTETGLSESDIEKYKVVAKKNSSKRVNDMETVSKTVRCEKDNFIAK